MTEDNIERINLDYYGAKYSHFAEADSKFPFKADVEKFSDSRSDDIQEFCIKQFGPMDEGRWFYMWEWGLGFKNKEDYTAFKLWH